MIKNLTLATLATLFLVGCGGGTTDEKSSSVSTTKEIKHGQYDLWQYMTPATSNTNTFTLSDNSVDSSYKSTYTVKNSRVEEVADYAKNEKTIYEKGDTSITIKFEKDGKANGTYALKLSADIDDVVTVRNSSCKLTQHFDSFNIEGKAFSDVIEITCGDIPGYYQKGIGEIAQKESKSGKSIRVLSN